MARWTVGSELLLVVGALLCSACGGADSDHGSDGLQLRTNLRAIWGSSRTDVWAVGEDATILHFDGARWSVVDSGVAPNPEDGSIPDLIDISGTGPTDVWAVGTDGLVLHFDGQSWSQSATDPSEHLIAVWAAAPDRVWAGGIREGTGYLRVWDGQRWSGTRVPAADSVWDIWGTSSTDAWIAGSRTGANNVGFLYHFDGAEWNTTDYNGASPRAGWAAHSSDVWVAAFNSPLQHWDGSHWIQGAEPEQLFGIWGTAPDNVWSAGPDGRVVHFDGQSWRAVPSDSAALLWGVWGSAADDVWVAGADGTLLHWDGAALGAASVVR